MSHRTGASAKWVVILAGLFISLNNEMAQAQSSPDFMQSLQNKIQQETQAGLINQKQAYKLQKKEAKIQQKIAKGLNKHGGRLTPAEMHSLAKKAKALNRSINQKVHNNNQDAVGVPIYQLDGPSRSANPHPNWNSDNPNMQPALRDRRL